MEVRDLVLNFIKEKYLPEGEALDYEDDVLTTGVLSSLAIMQLVLYLEQTYSLEIPPEDVVIEHFVSAQAIHDYVESVKS